MKETWIVLVHSDDGEFISEWHWECDSHEKAETYIDQLGRHDSYSLYRHCELVREG